MNSIQSKINPKLLELSMPTKSLEETFRKSLYILQRAANREVDLQYDYPKIYKKVKKFYINQGIEFCDIPGEDYRTVIDLISQDLLATTIN